MSTSTATTGTYVIELGGWPQIPENLLLEPATIRSLPSVYGEDDNPHHRVRLKAIDNAELQEWCELNTVPGPARYICLAPNYTEVMMRAPEDWSQHQFLYIIDTGSTGTVSVSALQRPANWGSALWVPPEEQTTFTVVETRTLQAGHWYNLQSCQYLQYQGITEGLVALILTDALENQQYRTTLLDTL